VPLHEINLRPARRDLRWFGLITLVVSGLLGALLYVKKGLYGYSLGASADVVAYGLWGVGLLSALFSLVWPAANRPLYVLLTLLTYPVGYVVSHLLMALFFYGVLTPLGLVFRLIGRDPLRRKFEPQATTYWEPHDKPASIKRYFQQF
jgi:hypothetical protein